LSTCSRGKWRISAKIEKCDSRGLRRSSWMRPQYPWTISLNRGPSVECDGDTPTESSKCHRKVDCSRVNIILRPQFRQSAYANEFDCAHRFQLRVSAQGLKPTLISMWESEFFLKIIRSANFFWTMIKTNIRNHNFVRDFAAQVQFDKFLWKTSDLSRNFTV
jgi:hypothetical protein